MTAPASGEGKVLAAPAARRLLTRGREGPGVGGLALVPGRRQRLGDQLYGQILDQILSGRLQEGDRLPTEKELCEVFGVSRPVVREALTRLQVDGLVQTRQGAGTTVRARPADRLRDFTPTQDVADLLRCIEVRLPLEGTAARLAAERRSEEQLAQIAAAQAEFARQVEAGTVQPEADLAFHASIAAATGNDFFPRLLQTVHETLTGFMRVSLSLTRTGSRDRARQVLEEHTRILEAIRAQDPEMAQVAMQFHIGQARRRMVDRNQSP